MNLPVNYSEINWLSVIVVTVISFPLGALWHSGKVFGKAWKEDIHSPVDPKNVNFARLFGLSALLHFVAVLGLEILIGNYATWGSGLHTGLFVSFFFVLTTIGVTHLFAARSIRLILIDAGFYIVFFSIAGLILGEW